MTVKQIIERSEKIDGDKMCVITDGKDYWHHKGGVMKKTKKLLILENSLEKKTLRLDELFGRYFTDVSQANGQPLNDKKNGQATLNRWEKQSNAIRNLEKGIEKTKKAIEVEKGKIIISENVKKKLPEIMLTMLKTGELIQWRKHPTFFFVDGVDKVRIIWDSKKNIIMHKYANRVTDKEQWKKFAQTFNKIAAYLNKINKEK